MHVLDSLLLAPGAELADGCRYHVEAAPATGYLKQVNCSVEHSCRLFDVALMDVREGQIPQDDRLRLVTALEPTRSPRQDRSRCPRTPSHVVRRTASRVGRWRASGSVSSS